MSESGDSAGTACIIRGIGKRGLAKLLGVNQKTFHRLEQGDFDDIPEVWEVLEWQLKKRGLWDGRAPSPIL